MAQYRHTKAELLQMQSLPLSIKIPMTKRRIKEFYDYYQGDVYLSWSGGKDSTVLKHIIEHMSGVWDVPMVFSDTGADRLEMKLDAIESAQKKRILANQITDTEGRANALNDVCNDVIKLCGM